MYCDLVVVTENSNNVPENTEVEDRGESFYDKSPFGPHFSGSCHDSDMHDLPRLYELFKR